MAIHALHSPTVLQTDWVNQVTSHQEILSFLHDKKKSIHPNRDMAPFFCQMDSITVLITSETEEATCYFHKIKKNLSAPNVISHSKQETLTGT